MILFAVVLGLITFTAFFGNLAVLLVVAIYDSFHRTRYLLLASLALSDLLFAVLITSNRSVSVGLEKWIFATPWCQVAAYFARALYLSTVFHLCAVSYEQYWAICKHPFNYDGRLTKKCLLASILVLWVAPAALCIGPFIGWGAYVYSDRPEIFACETKWDKATAFPFLVISFIVPFGVIFFLNYKIMRVVRRIKYSVKTVFPLQCDVDDNSEQHEPLGEPSAQQQKDKRRPEKKNETMWFGDHDHYMSVLDNDLEHVTANNLSKVRPPLHTLLDGHHSPQNPNSTSVDDNHGLPNRATLLTVTENTIHHPRDNNFMMPSLKGHSSERKARPLGKTQMRIAILLKEGKAAVDSMIVVGVFVLCAFPLWIAGLYRTFGVLSAEAILTAHCLYSSSLVWYPVVCSIRKKEFREGVRKLLPKL